MKNFSFTKKIREHFDIEPIIDLSIIPYIIRNNKRYIIKIIVNESLVKPLILKYQGMALIFKRRDGFTSPATSEEIIQMSLVSKRPRFDQGSTTTTLIKMILKHFINSIRNILHTI